MAAPRLKLGGIEVPLHAGAPRVGYAAAGGAEDARLSGGKLVRMRHWKKWQITISGTGWMATGLDVLDFDQYLDLWCPKPKRVATTSTEVRIQTDARPDVPVEAHALVGRDWVPTPVTMDGRDATITPVAGALQYSVVWFPRFQQVLCVPPDEDSSAGDVAWQIVANEV